MYTDPSLSNPNHNFGPRFSRATTMEVQQSITLGDALKRLSNNVQTELQNTLFLMRGQDPELRTTELRAFLSRTRAKLSQMYAMLRWLTSPGISQCFRSIADFNGQLQTMKGDMARNLDEMYFCHASIFSMRSRPLEITKAKDILARETYYNLPAAMFSCGKPDFPNDLEPASVSRDLTVYIRTKLSLEDISGLPFPLVTTIQDGLLTIECSHYFKLFLTLKTLHEGAQWCVLNCLLLNDAAPNAPVVGTFDSDKALLEKKLAATLRSIASAEPVAASDEGAAVESKTPELVRNVLQELLQECRHIAVTASVGLLHQQLATAPQCVAYFRDAAQAVLVEESVGGRIVAANTGNSHLSLKMWRSAFHGEAQFEVKVCPRARTTSSTPVSNDQDVVIYLHTTLTYRAPTLVFSDEKRSFAVPGAGALLRGDTYISAGCDAAQLVRDALALLAGQKLDVLAVRIRYSAEKIGNVATALTVTRGASSLTLTHAQCPRSALHIRLDARDGKYLVDAADLGDVAVSERKVLDLFGTEINNLDSENFISNYLLKHGISSSPASTGQVREEGPFAHILLGTPVITTLDDVVGLFDLCLWSEHLHAACPTAHGQHGLVPKLMPAVGLHRSRGLVYNLQCWEDLGASASGTLSAEYVSLFPASHTALTRDSLAANLVPQAAAAKRNVAKKRGFSEAALASTIPGDFVSAASLQAEMIAEQKVSFAPVKQIREVTALYVVIGIDQARQATAVGAVCKCRVTVSGGVIDPTSAVPVVLHRRSSVASAEDFRLSVFVQESRAWAKALMRAPAPPSSFGFVSTSADKSAAPVRTDLLAHTDGGLSALFVDADDKCLHITGVGYGVELSTAPRSAWKSVINSVSGHFSEPVDLINLAALSHNGATLCDLTLSLLRAADGADSVEVLCTRAVLRFPQSFQDPTAYAATGVFAAQFAQSMFRQWTLPVPVNGGVKTEILKRAKFVRDVWWVLQALTEPAQNKRNGQNGQNGHSHEDAMEVDGEHSGEPAASATRQLQPLHFTITPSPSTSSASGCTAQLVLALHGVGQPNAASPAKTASFVSLGAYLLVTFTYHTSTMRGMGKSISTAETSEVVFADVVPGKFSRSHSVRELGEERGALLKSVLSDYLQLHR